MNLTPQEHLQLISNALDAATKKGVYSLTEVEKIIVSIHSLAKLINNTDEKI